MFKKFLFIFILFSISTFAGNGDISPGSSASINNTSSEHGEQDHPNAPDEDDPEKEEEKDPDDPCVKNKEACKAAFRGKLNTFIADKFEPHRKLIKDSRKSAGPPSKGNCFDNKASNGKSNYDYLTDLKQQQVQYIADFKKEWEKLKCPCYTKGELKPLADEVYAEPKYKAALEKADDTLGYVEWWLNKCRRNRSVGGAFDHDHNNGNSGSGSNFGVTGGGSGGGGDGTPSASYVAINDKLILTGSQNSYYVVDVLANDIFPNNNRRKYIYIDSAPLYGTVQVVEGKVHYFPPENFYGQDTFYYHFRDSNGLTSNYAKVVVRATKPNEEYLISFDYKQNDFEPVWGTDVTRDDLIDDLFTTFEYDYSEEIFARYIYDGKGGSSIVIDADRSKGFYNMKGPELYYGQKFRFNSKLKKNFSNKIILFQDEFVPGNEENEIPPQELQWGITTNNKIYFMWNVGGDEISFETVNAVDFSDYVDVTLNADLSKNTVGQAFSVVINNSTYALTNTSQSLGRNSLPYSCKPLNMVNISDADQGVLTIDEFRIVTNIEDPFSFTNVDEFNHSERRYDFLIPGDEFIEETRYSYGHLQALALNPSQLHNTRKYRRSVTSHYQFNNLDDYTSNHGVYEINFALDPNIDIPGWINKIEFSVKLPGDNWRKVAEIPKSKKPSYGIWWHHYFWNAQELAFDWTADQVELINIPKSTEYKLSIPEIDKEIIITGNDSHLLKKMFVYDQSVSAIQPDRKFSKVQFDWNKENIIREEVSHHSDVKDLIVRYKIGPNDLYGSEIPTSILENVTSTGIIEDTNYEVLFYGNLLEASGPITYNSVKESGRYIYQTYTLFKDDFYPFSRVLGDTFIYDVDNNVYGIGIIDGTIQDDKVPYIPVITASAGDGSVTLTWTYQELTNGRETDIETGSVTVEYSANGQLISKDLGNVRHAVITGLENGVNYNFTLKTFDLYGNLIHGSVQATPQKFTKGKFEVNSFEAFAGTNSAVLKWKYNSQLPEASQATSFLRWKYEDSDFEGIGFLLFRQDGQISKLIAALPVKFGNPDHDYIFFDRGLEPDKDYTYKIITLDRKNNRSNGLTKEISTYSNEALESSELFAQIDFVNSQSSINTSDNKAWYGSELGALPDQILEAQLPTYIYSNQELIFNATTDNLGLFQRIIEENDVFSASIEAKVLGHDFYNGGITIFEFRNYDNETKKALVIFEDRVEFNGKAYAFVHGEKVHRYNISRVADQIELIVDGYKLKEIGNAQKSLPREEGNAYVRFGAKAQDNDLKAVYSDLYYVIGSPLSFGEGLDVEDATAPSFNGNLVVSNNTGSVNLSGLTVDNLQEASAFQISFSNGWTLYSAPNASGQLNIDIPLPSVPQDVSVSLIDQFGNQGSVVSAQVSPNQIQNSGTLKNYDVVRILNEAEEDIDLDYVETYGSFKVFRNRQFATLPLSSTSENWSLELTFALKANTYRDIPSISNATLLKLIDEKEEEYSLTAGSTSLVLNNDIIKKIALGGSKYSLRIVNQYISENNSALHFYLNGKYLNSVRGFDLKKIVTGDISGAGNILQESLLLVTSGHSHSSMDGLSGIWVSEQPNLTINQGQTFRNAESINVSFNSEETSRVNLRLYSKRSGRFQQNSSPVQSFSNVPLTYYNTVTNSFESISSLLVETDERPFPYIIKVIPVGANGEVTKGDAVSLNQTNHLYNGTLVNNFALSESLNSAWKVIKNEAEVTNTENIYDYIRSYVVLTGPDSSYTGSVSPDYLELNQTLSAQNNWSFETYIKPGAFRGTFLRLKTIDDSNLDVAFNGSSILVDGKEMLRLSSSKLHKLLAQFDGTNVKLSVNKDISLDIADITVNPELTVQKIQFGNIEYSGQTAAQPQFTLPVLTVDGQGYSSLNDYDTKWTYISSNGWVKPEVETDDDLGLATITTGEEESVQLVYDNPAMNLSGYWSAEFDYSTSNYQYIRVNRADGKRVNIGFSGSGHMRLIHTSEKLFVLNGDDFRVYSIYSGGESDNSLRFEVRDESSLSIKNMRLVSGAVDHSSFDDIRDIIFTEKESFVNGQPQQGISKFLFAPAYLSLDNESLNWHFDTFSDDVIPSFDVNNAQPYTQPIERIYSPGKYGVTVVDSSEFKYPISNLNPSLQARGDLTVPFDLKAEISKNGSLHTIDLNWESNNLSIPTTEIKFLVEVFDELGTVSQVIIPGNSHSVSLDEGIPEEAKFIGRELNVNIYVEEYSLDNGALLARSKPAALTVSTFDTKSVTLTNDTPFVHTSSGDRLINVTVTQQPKDLFGYLMWKKHPEEHTNAVIDKIVLKLDDDAVSILDNLSSNHSVLGGQRNTEIDSIRDDDISNLNVKSRIFFYHPDIPDFAVEFSPAKNTNIPYNLALDPFDDGKPYIQADGYKINLGSNESGLSLFPEIDQANTPDGINTVSFQAHPVNRSPRIADAQMTLRDQDGNKLPLAAALAYDVENKWIKNDITRNIPIISPAVQSLTMTGPTVEDRSLVEVTVFNDSAPLALKENNNHIIYSASRTLAEGDEDNPNPQPFSYSSDKRTVYDFIETGSFDPSVLFTEGPNFLTVQAKDDDGAVSKASLLSGTSLGVNTSMIIYDKSGPSFSFIGLDAEDGLKASIDSSFILKGLFTDQSGLSDISIKINGVTVALDNPSASYINGNGTFWIDFNTALAGLNPGAHSIEVSMTDLVGNTSQQSVEFIYTGQAVSPKAYLKTVNNIPERNALDQLLVAFDKDGLSNSDIVKVQINGKELGVNSQQVDEKDLFINATEATPVVFEDFETLGNIDTLLDGIGMASIKVFVKTNEMPEDAEPLELISTIRWYNNAEGPEVTRISPPASKVFSNANGNASIDQMTINFVDRSPGVDVDSIIIKDVNGTDITNSFNLSANSVSLKETISLPVVDNNISIEISMSDTASSPLTSTTVLSWLALTDSAVPFITSIGTLEFWTDQLYKFNIHGVNLQNLNNIELINSTDGTTVDVPVKKFSGNAESGFITVEVEISETGLYTFNLGGNSQEQFKLSVSENPETYSAPLISVNLNSVPNSNLGGGLSSSSVPSLPLNQGTPEESNSDCTGITLSKLTQHGITLDSPQLVSGSSSVKYSGQTIQLKGHFDEEVLHANAHVYFGGNEIAVEEASIGKDSQGRPTFVFSNIKLRNGVNNVLINANREEDGWGKTMEFSIVNKTEIPEITFNFDSSKLILGYKSLYNGLTVEDEYVEHGNYKLDGVVTSKDKVPLVKTTFKILLNNIEIPESFYDVEFSDDCQTATFSLKPDQKINIAELYASILDKFFSEEELLYRSHILTVMVSDGEGKTAIENKIFNFSRGEKIKRYFTHSVSRDSLPNSLPGGFPSDDGDIIAILENIRDLVSHDEYDEVEDSVTPNLYKMIDESSGTFASLLNVEDYGLYQAIDKFGNLKFDLDGSPIYQYTKPNEGEASEFRFTPNHAIYDPKLAKNDLSKWQKLSFGRVAKGASSTNAIIEVVDLYEGGALERVSDNHLILDYKNIFSTALPGSGKIIKTKVVRDYDNSTKDVHFYTFDIQSTSTSSSGGEKLELELRNLYNPDKDKFDLDTSTGTLNGNVSINISYNKETYEINRVVGTGRGGGLSGGFGGGSYGGGVGGGEPVEYEEPKGRVNKTTAIIPVNGSTSFSFSHTGDGTAILPKDSENYDFRKLGASPGAFGDRLEVKYQGSLVSENPPRFDQSGSLSIKGLYPSIHGTANTLNTAQHSDNIPFLKSGNVYYSMNFYEHLQIQVHGFLLDGDLEETYASISKVTPEVALNPATVRVENVDNVNKLKFDVVFTDSILKYSNDTTLVTGYKAYVNDIQQNQIDPVGLNLASRKFEVIVDNLEPGLRKIKVSIQDPLSRVFNYYFNFEIGDQDNLSTTLEDTFIKSLQIVPDRYSVYENKLDRVSIVGEFANDTDLSLSDNIDEFNPEGSSGNSGQARSLKLLKDGRFGRYKRDIFILDSFDISRIQENTSQVKDPANLPVISSTPGEVVELSKGNQSIKINVAGIIFNDGANRAENYIYIEEDGSKELSLTEWHRGDYDTNFKLFVVEGSGDYVELTTEEDFIPFENYILNSNSLEFGAVSNTSFGSDGRKEVSRPFTITYTSAPNDVRVTYNLDGTPKIHLKDNERVFVQTNAHSTSITPRAPTSLKVYEAITGVTPEVSYSLPTPWMNVDASVLMHNRQLKLTHSNFAIPGRSMPVFTGQTYRSGSKGTTTLGPGWYASWEIYFKKTEKGFVFNPGNGRKDEFLYTHGSNSKLISVPPGYPIKAELINSSIVLTSTSGTVTKFISVGDYFFIESVEDKYGNKMSYEYNRNWRVHKIIDDKGRQYIFHYKSNGRIETIEELNNEFYTYSYEAGKLKKVFSTHGVTVNYDYYLDSTDIKTVGFNDQSIQYFKFNYDSNASRITSVSRFSSNNTNAIVDTFALGSLLGGTGNKHIDANNVSTHYKFKETDGEKMLCQEVAVGSSSLSLLKSSKLYNAEQRTTQVTDPLNGKTVTVYESAASTDDKRGSELPSSMNVYADNRGKVNDGNSVTTLTTTWTYKGKYYQLDEFTSADGVLTKYEYSPDKLENLEWIERTLQTGKAKEYFTFNEYGQVATHKSINNLTTTYNYYSDSKRYDGGPSQEGYLYSKSWIEDDVTYTTFTSRDDYGRVTVSGSSTKKGNDEQHVQSETVYKFNGLVDRVYETTAKNAEKGSRPYTEYIYDNRYRLYQTKYFLPVYENNQYKYIESTTTIERDLYGRVDITGTPNQINSGQNIIAYEAGKTRPFRIDHENGSSTYIEYDEYGRKEKIITNAPLGLNSTPEEGNLFTESMIQEIEYYNDSTVQFSRSKYKNGVFIGYEIRRDGFGRAIETEDLVTEATEINLYDNKGRLETSIVNAFGRTLESQTFEFHDNSDTSKIINNLTDYNVSLNTNYVNNTESEVFKNGDFLINSISSVKNNIGFPQSMTVNGRQYNYDTDHFGNILKVSIPGYEEKVKEITRSDRGDVESVRVPGAGTFSYKRTGNGDVSEVTDARGNTSVAEFDSTGARIGKNKDTRLEESHNNIAQRFSLNVRKHIGDLDKSQTVKISYDYAGRVLRKDIYNGYAPEDASVEPPNSPDFESYEYDTFGRVMSHRQRDGKIHYYNYYDIDDEDRKKRLKLDNIEVDNTVVRKIDSYNIFSKPAVMFEYFSDDYLSYTKLTHSYYGEDGISSLEQGSFGQLKSETTEVAINNKVIVEPATISYEYDSKGRLLRTVYPPSKSGGVNESVKNVYNDFGTMLESYKEYGTGRRGIFKYILDADSLLPVNLKINYEMDDEDNNEHSLIFNHKSSGVPQLESIEENSQTLQAYDYNPNGQIDSENIWQEGEKTKLHDGLDRVTNVTASNSFAAESFNRDVHNNLVGNNAFDGDTINFTLSNNVPNKVASILADPNGVISRTGAISNSVPQFWVSRLFDVKPGVEAGAYNATSGQGFVEKSWDPVNEVYVYTPSDLNHLAETYSVPNIDPSETSFVKLEDIDPNDGSVRYYDWQIDLPNGVYAVEVVAGDYNDTESTRYQLHANGQTILDGFNDPENDSFTLKAHQLVTVTNGKLRIGNGPDTDEPGSEIELNKLCSITIHYWANKGTVDNPQQALAAQIALAQAPQANAQSQESFSHNPDPNGNYEKDHQFNYTYDVFHRLVKAEDRKYDEDSSSHPTPKFAQYIYDSLDRKVAVLYSWGEGEKEYRDPHNAYNRRGWFNTQFIYNGYQLAEERRFGHNKLDKAESESVNRFFYQNGSIIMVNGTSVITDSRGSAIKYGNLFYNYSETGLIKAFTQTDNTRLLAQNNYGYKMYYPLYPIGWRGMIHDPFTGLYEYPGKGHYSTILARFLKDDGLKPLMRKYVSGDFGGIHLQDKGTLLVDENFMEPFVYSMKKLQKFNKIFGAIMFSPAAILSGGGTAFLTGGGIGVGVDSGIRQYNGEDVTLSSVTHSFFGGAISLGGTSAIGGGLRQSLFRSGVRGADNARAAAARYAKSLRPRPGSGGARSVEDFMAEAQALVASKRAGTGLLDGSGDLFFRNIDESIELIARNNRGIIDDLDNFKIAISDDIAFRSINFDDIDNFISGVGVQRIGGGKTKHLANTIANNAPSAWIPITESLDVLRQGMFIGFKKSKTNYRSLNDLLNSPLLKRQLNDKARYLIQQGHGAVKGSISMDAIDYIVIGKKVIRF